MRRIIVTRHLKVPSTEGPSFANTIHLVPASSIPPVPIGWIWPFHLAKGKAHILAGAPGTGKTNISIYVAAIVSNGGSWPDGTFAPGGKVVIWTGEDGIADTIIARLIAAGANMDNILILRGTVEHGRERTFDFTKDFDLLKAEIEAIGDVALVVIDSIAQVVKGDANKNSEVRQALAPLIELGEKHECAILGLTHLNKNSKGKEPLDRVNGSVAYGAVARIVMLTAKVKTADPDAPTTGVLVRAKSNIGPNDGGFEYQIHPVTFLHDGKTFHTSKVVFNPAPLKGSAKEILQFAESGDVLDSNGAVAQAAEFLTAILAQDGMTVQAIQEHASAAGIAMSAVKRAKSALGVRSEKQVGSGLANPPTMWVLPIKPVIGQPAATNMGAPKYSTPATFPSRHQSDRPSMSEVFAEPTVPRPLAAVDPVDAVAPATAKPEAANGLNKPLLDLCSGECRRLLDHATSSSDDDALSSVDEIVEAAIKRFVGESAPGNKLIEKYRNALRQLDIFRNLE